MEGFPKEITLSWVLRIRVISHMRGWGTQEKFQVEDKITRLGGRAWLILGVAEPEFKPWFHYFLAI